MDALWHVWSIHVHTFFVLFFVWIGVIFSSPICTLCVAYWMNWWHAFITIFMLVPCEVFFVFIKHFCLCTVFSVLSYCSMLLNLFHYLIVSLASGRAELDFDFKKITFCNPLSHYSYLDRPRRSFSSSVSSVGSFRLCSFFDDQVRDFCSGQSQTAMFNDGIWCSSCI